MNYRKETLKYLVSLGWTSSQAKQIEEHNYRQVLRKYQKLDGRSERTINVSRELYYNLVYQDKSSFAPYKTINIDMNTGLISGALNEKQVYEQQFNPMFEKIKGNKQLETELHQIIDDYASNGNRKKFESKINKFKSSAKYKAQ